MEGLSFDNILSESEADALFSSDIQVTPPEHDGENETKETDDKATEDSQDSLFDDPESVGSEALKEQEDTSSSKGTSPKNFYSSIAKALTEEGIFPDLDDDTLSKVNSPEEFRNLIEKLIQEGLDYRQKRVDDALNAGVQVSEVKKYESILDYLDNIEEDAIKSEEEEGENLRKNLIYQDFINRGYSNERAEREVLKSFKGGTDIEDAIEAIQSNKDFFKQQYSRVVEQSRNEQQQQIDYIKKQHEELRESMLNNKKVFGDLEVDSSVRKKAFDNISKPVYKDPKTGQIFTAVQKYERENPTEFLKNVGILYTMTNGFKNIDSLIKGKVRKEVKKGLRDLEATLNGTSRTSDGVLTFANDSSDPESKLTDWSIDI